MFEDKQGAFEKIQSFLQINLKWVFKRCNYDKEHKTKLTLANFS